MNAIGTTTLGTKTGTPTTGTQTTGTLHKIAMQLGLALCLASLGASTAGSSLLLAQTRGPVQRTVHGTVEEKGAGKLKGAIVYLRDARTSQVKTAFSDDDGSYRFVQLTENTDYELWAQTADNKRKSKTKSISSFDSKKDITLTLVID